jgi:hypothetical protein
MEFSKVILKFLEKFESENISFIKYFNDLTESNIDVVFDGDDGYGDLWEFFGEEHVLIFREMVDVFLVNHCFTEDKENDEFDFNKIKFLAVIECNARFLTDKQAIKVYGKYFHNYNEHRGYFDIHERALKALFEEYTRQKNEIRHLKSTLDID